MERLTYKDASGNWVVACNKFWNYMKLKFPAHIRGEAVDRLAAYENTGVEPTDVITATNMAKIACALHELNQYKELGNLDHLRELVEADKAGRIKILPEYTGKVCGTCGHFLRITGTCRGKCAVKPLASSRYGSWNTPFEPSQSRKACKQYEPQKGDVNHDQP